MQRTKIEWTDYDLGWLSALIDGEGCICLLKEKRLNQKAGCQYKPRLSIGNKNLNLLRKAQSLMGEAIIGPGKNDVYELQVSANNMRRVLPVIKLIVKEGQRNLIIHALNLLKKRHRGRGNPMTQKEIDIFEAIYMNIRALNGKVWSKK